MAWVEKRKDRWQGRYRDPANKVRVAGSRSSKREALKLAQDEEAKIRHGVWQDPTAGSLTFATYFEEHWLPNKIAELTTIEGYESHYNSELKAAFGAVELRKLSTPLIQRWVVGLQKRGVSPGTIRAKYRTLCTVLGGQRGVSAVRDRLIRDNPCKGVDLPYSEKRKKLIYSVAEVDTLMAALGPWWRPIPIMAADTGFRWGELMGLTVADFSADFTAVSLERTIIEVKKSKTENGTRFLVKPYPKNQQSRRVVITPEVATLVQTMVHERRLFPADRLFSMPDRHGSLPVRTDAWPQGLPIGRSLFRERHWKPAHAGSDGKNLEPRRFHDLRGSHVSWLLAGGADVVTVMERVGHESLETTMAYVRAMDDADHVALRALQATRTRGRNADAC